MLGMLPFRLALTDGDIYLSKGFLQNVLSGSGGTYDSTKEDEVKKVHFLMNFTDNFYITVNFVCRILLAFLNDGKSQSNIYIYIFFLLKQIQAKLKAQMVGIQVQFEKIFYICFKVSC